MTACGICFLIWAFKVLTTYHLALLNLGVTYMDISLLKINLKGKMIKELLPTYLLVLIQFTWEVIQIQKFTMCILLGSISVEWIFEVGNQQKKVIGSPNVVHRKILTSQMPFVCWDYPLLDYSWINFRRIAINKERHPSLNHQTL